jgi:electron transport complex protein RnfE
MAKNKTSLIREFTKGLWDENPVLRMLLGLCPTLAITNSAINGLSMGLAVLFTLTCSSIIISAFRKVIPKEVRIPTFIVVIATFVTITDLTLAAKFPEISKALGPFIPLIVVNCMILGRQEAFASKNPIGRSIIDALGMSLGFAFTLTVLGAIRELLGAGTIFTVQLMPDSFAPWMIMILPPGAFLTLGLMIGAANWINDKVKT